MNNKNESNTNIDLMSDEVAILDLVRIIRESAKLIIGTALVFSMISIIYSFLLTPIYQVKLEMIPSEKAASSGTSLSSSMGMGGLASLAGITLPQTLDGTETSLAVMQSRVFLEDFLIDNQILRHLYKDDWDDLSNTWKDAEPKMWSAVNNFKGLMRVKRDLNSGVISLSLEWEDPVMAASWLNELVISINSHLQKEVIEEGKESILYLQEQLQNTKLAKLENVIYQLIGEQTKEIMLANVNKDYGFKVLDPAVVPLERISPRRKVIVILGTILGLISGIGYAFLSRFVSNLNKVDSKVN